MQTIQKSIFEFKKNLFLNERSNNQQLSLLDYSNKEKIFEMVDENQNVFFRKDKQQRRYFSYNLASLEAGIVCEDDESSYASEEKEERKLKLQRL